MGPPTSLWCDKADIFYTEVIMKIKEFKTWDEQVAKLIEHGCKDIKSNEYAIDILQKG